MDPPLNAPPADIEIVLDRLQASRFRRRFRLGPRERLYLQTRGRDRVLEQARKFIDQRLAPAHPPHDGRQTPLGGHPVFVAQHATATCCRSCLSRWHHIPGRRTLCDKETDYVVRLIDRWLQRQPDGGTPDVVLPLFASVEPRGPTEGTDSRAGTGHRRQAGGTGGGTAVGGSR